MKINEVKMTNIKFIDHKKKKDPRESMPMSEFYATIKGPNYDNVWITHDNFGKELGEQIDRNSAFTKSKQFMGMSDEELLANKTTFLIMGLLK